MTEKRLTAAETRAAQVAREKEKQDHEAAARRNADQQRRDADEQLILSNAAHIKSHWYEAVQAAAKKEAVRFVALARVMSDVQHHPAVVELKQQIEADGYECVFFTQLSFQGKTGPLSLGHYPDDSLGCESQTGGARGWKVADSRQFGHDGTTSWLAVKW